MYISILDGWDSLCGGNNWMWQSQMFSLLGLQVSRVRISGYISHSHFQFLWSLSKRGTIKLGKLNIDRKRRELGRRRQNRALPLLTTLSGPRWSDVLLALLAQAVWIVRRVASLNRCHNPIRKYICLLFWTWPQGYPSRKLLTYNIMNF